MQHSGGRGRWFSELEASLVYKSGFQDSQGHTEKPCLGKKKKKKKEKQTKNKKWGSELNKEFSPEEY